MSIDSSTLSPQEVLFLLIRVALGKCSDSVPWFSTDWAELIRIARRQSVVSLAGEGVCCLYSHDGYSCSLDLEENRQNKRKLLGLQLIADDKYAAMTKAVHQFDAILNENNVKALVFKGLSLSQYYPQPSHREFLDVDFYPIGVDFRRVDDLLLQSGGKCTHMAPKHSQISFRGFSFEGHRFFVWDFASREKKQMNHFFESTLKSAYPLPGYTNILQPPVEFDTVFVLEHMANHFRMEGISLRHVIDWMLVVEKAGESFDWQRLEQYRLKNFASILNSIARQLFGASISEIYCECNPKQKERVLADIMDYNSKSVPSSAGFSHLWYKITRFFTRTWTYSLTGQSFISTVWRSLVSHILEPDRIF